VGLRINNNIAAMNAYRNLSATDSQMSKSLEKLSSGFRINRAADDAAGLSISEGMRAQIGGLTVAGRNAQDGISLVQTAEGALQEVHSLLQRVRDLAVQSANTGTTTQAARDAAAAEVTQSLAEIDRISNATEFNGKKILDGSTTSYTFQVGAGAGAENQTTVSISAMNSSGLTLTGTAATKLSADLAGTSVEATGGKTIALTYNDGGPSSTDHTTTVAVAANTRNGSTGDYDMANASDRTALVNAINTGLQNGTGGKVRAELVVGGTVATPTYKIKYTTAGTGTTATLNLTTDGITAIAAGAAAGSAAGSIATDIAAGLTSSITAIDTAIAKVSDQRANLGAYQNRFEHTIANLSVTVENLSASESRIRDTDMASEMVKFTRSQILTQAGTAMLAQANQSSQSVLTLLRG
jgi:flagellin-like hook-associated protein FlgL